MSAGAGSGAARGGRYRCARCGASARALYRRYGPAVLKLCSCEECGGTVDKYVEYDPVIVMIDLILVSREAQRHILFNTLFETYWKLFMILAVLETYGVWCKNNIINLGVESLCQVTHPESMHYNNDSIPFLSDFWGEGCSVWTKEVKIDETDPFISEKAFYIVFASVCAGTAAFTLTIHTVMKVASVCCLRKSVPVLSLLKAVTLGNMSLLFTLPLLIWGITDSQTKTIHMLLVFAYSFLVFTSILSVMYNFNICLTVITLALSYCAKFIFVFIVKCTIDKFV